MTHEAEPDTTAVEDAIKGLEEALAGQFLSDEELDEALGLAPAQ